MDRGRDRHLDAGSASCDGRRCRIDAFASNADRQIAARFVLSPNTPKTHVSHCGCQTSMRSPSPIVPPYSRMRAIAYPGDGVRQARVPVRVRARTNPPSTLPAAIASTFFIAHRGTPVAARSIQPNAIADGVDNAFASALPCSEVSAVATRERRRCKTGPKGRGRHGSSSASTRHQLAGAFPRPFEHITPACCARCDRRTRLLAATERALQNPTRRRHARKTVVSASVIECDAGSSVIVCGD